MEEFIDDIVDSSGTTKTESEMAADIQGPEGDKSEKNPKANAELGVEDGPDVVQIMDKAKAEVDPVKELAAQLGWREDHTGEDAVDAKTYILKSKDIQKSMSQHNKDLKNQLHGLSGSLESLQKHNETVYHAEVKKLTKEISILKKERRAAIELADVDKVDELDIQIDDIQKDLNKPKQETRQETDNIVYDAWVEDNEWYIVDDEMAAFADNVAQQYIGAPLERIYAIVKSKVEEVFPDRFELSIGGNHSATKIVKDADPIKTPVGPQSPVESSSAKGSNTHFTKADLTSDQMQIMNQFVKGGIMTEEQYVNDIAKMQ